MSGAKSLLRFSIWHILVACLLMGLITWWLFEQRIERIDDRIEFMHKN